MAIIQELGQNLDTVVTVVRTVHRAINSCTNDSTAPMAQIQSDLQEVPRVVASLTNRLTEVSTMVSTVQRQLQQLQLDLLAEASRVSLEDNERVDALEKSGKEAGERLDRLTRSVRDAIKEVDRRTQDLGTGASNLSLAAGKAGSEASALGQTQAPAREALTKSELIAQTTYDTGLFAQLAQRLKALQDRIDADTTDTVPTAGRKLSETLRGEHTVDIQKAYKSFQTACEIGQADYLKVSTVQAQAMREAELLKLTDLLTLSQQTLPEVARTNTETAVEYHRRLAELAQRLFKSCDETFGYLNKEHAPFYPAVKELHIALKGMVGR